MVRILRLIDVKRPAAPMPFDDGPVVDSGPGRLISMEK